MILEVMSKKQLSKRVQSSEEKAALEMGLGVSKKENP